MQIEFLQSWAVIVAACIIYFFSCTLLGIIIINLIIYSILVKRPISGCLNSLIFLSVCGPFRAHRGSTASLCLRHECPESGRNVTAAVFPFGVVFAHLIHFFPEGVAFRVCLYIPFWAQQSMTSLPRKAANDPIPGPGIHYLLISSFSRYILLSFCTSLGTLSQRPVLLFSVLMYSDTLRFWA